MHLQPLRVAFEVHLPRLLRSPCHHSPRRIPRRLRTYATHRDAGGFQPSPTSSLLSQALDQKQRGSQKSDSVGPFQLGLSQPSFGEGDVKKWSELSTGGKAMRATARTTNFTVILLGAGLTTVLVYALTSELFSRNSPTVLYNDACERIKSSPKVARYLQGSLTFHNNPPSVLRPRHRNRHVSSQIVLDSSGREHMLLNFYIQANANAPDSSSSYFEWASDWVKDTVTDLPELSWNDTVSWTKDRATRASDSAKELFRYLTGDPVPSKATTAGVMSERARHEVPPKEEPKGVWGGFTGLFGSLKGASRKADGGVDVASGKIYQEGEVHADLIRDAAGYFVFRYILIDIPNSQGRNPVRVFVERAEGVRENEPVIRWVQS
ncbi:hypothetical protein FA95DRAFT_1555434 [Auriscalpium vulgare]|uniref:Uncharacterized protein n=1 Tax=Auriscalpium vulgare TaxID=40419 RepID=A0ACB8S364_9AGAM|nr:hypothetical protein FA95DRAFT_1555434 [Auriscalpium vulgare]